jgi:predicted GNAT family acetyltransferase
MTLTDNTADSRFELRIDDVLAGWVDYLPAGDSVILAHTEVLEGHEGEGLGGVLVRGALEGMRAKGKTVIPTCPFAAAYIQRNPELSEFVVEGLR